MLKNKNFFTLFDSTYRGRTCDRGSTLDKRKLPSFRLSGDKLGKGGKPSPSPL